MSRAAKVVVRCADGCKAEGHPERGVHSHFCDSEARWKLSMRLRTQELRTNAARKAANQIGDRAKADRAVLIGIIWGLRNEVDDQRVQYFKDKADAVLAKEKAGTR